MNRVRVPEHAGHEPAQNGPQKTTPQICGAWPRTSPKASGGRGCWVNRKAAMPSLNPVSLPLSAALQARCTPY